ncbi:hypothetical protein AMTRI_Chr10g227100 [Amborella trichopoda]|uniref:DUF7722 domain-containing protein n=1 Tax=Amborella trichopoda TaxID=13333 RepID=U5DBG6_AMBTC|nr:uncharacterized protein LOC18446083 [Amborella trichopoda]ERN17753.1 hypothetical protein AMTR_s00047p00088970 [Amborella trichopoda]|eukprot:XP_006856286.1 uncharacterized protein LOC18446083 [Amborella trichopoda]
MGLSIGFVALETFIHTHIITHVLGKQLEGNFIGANALGHGREEKSNGSGQSREREAKRTFCVGYPKVSDFQMPLHYPRYTKEDYMKMPEWRVDLLLKEYGLFVEGTLQEKREYAMGAFLWPDQI